MIRRTLCLVVLCTIFLEVGCLGADYYVDAAGGNDRNPGHGEATAWKSIGKVNAYTGFVPGDRILLKRGQIWREQLIVSVSGTADRPIAFGAYGAGSRPVLKGSTLVVNWTEMGRANCWRAPLAAAPSQVFFNGVRGIKEGGPDTIDRRLEWAWSSGVLYVYSLGDPGGVYEFPGIEASVRPSTRTDGLIHIKDREYVTVQDIDATQSSGFGIYIKPWARHITVRGCGVSHSRDGGLVAPAAGGAGASQITVEDCLIHHNNGGFKEGAPGVATYHEGLTMENVDGFVIRRTRVYDNYMEGVNFKRGARNGVIEYCDLYSNDLINLYLEGATDIQIRYNRIYDCIYNAGIEFGLETNTHHNDTIRIHHNLFWGNSGAISFWAGAFIAQTRNISIDNNTFYNNEFSIRWKSSATDNYSGTNYIRNNLFWPYRPGWVAISDQTAGRQALAQTIVAHNVFQRGALTDVMGDSVRIAADPHMVSPASHNFHLRAGSACIDGGMNVGLTRDYDGHVIPQGQAPDVGAHEYLFPGGGSIYTADADLAAAGDRGEPWTQRADRAVWDMSLHRNETAAVSDGPGNIWILWHAGSDGDRQIYVSRSSSDPAVAPHVKPLTQGRGDRCNPALAMDGSGLLCAAWQENVQGIWDIGMSISIDGDTWARPRKVADTGGNQTNPAVAADRRFGGRLAVAWQDDSAGNQDVYVLSSPDQFATSTLSRVTADSADQTDPAVAVDSDGTIVVLWTDARNGSTDIYGAASDRGPWANQSVIDIDSNQSQPAVAAGSGGRVLHVVWTDDVGGDLDIFYASLNGLPHGSVTGQGIVDDTSGADQHSPAIAVMALADGADRVVACWEDGRGGTAGQCLADLSPGSIRTNVVVRDEEPGGQIE